MAQVIKSTPLYEGRTFRLVSEQVALDNGVTTELDIIRHPGASAIVPMIASDQILLLQQYRHAVGGNLWEIPAGTFDGDEDPLVCAQRELTEETGYRADMWQKLGAITPVPGYSDECIHIFYAADMTPVEQHLDVDEIIEVHTFDFQEALDMIYAGAIRDSKTIAGLFLAQKQIQFK